jgi:AAA+ ATPase superfamily predicted ATPase
MAESHRRWGFYGRTAERSEITRILGLKHFFFCTISGRRRIGKTTLIREALKFHDDLPTLYLQVPDSDERGVVQAFRDAVEDSGLLDTLRSRDSNKIEDIGEIRNFSVMARTIGFLCRAGAIVILDEFQYFHRTVLYEFTSHLQAEVDRLRDTRRGGIFVLGSIHTQMTAILEDRNSPLFNRVTHRIELHHWKFETLFEMFDTHHVRDPGQMLFLWTLFEGVPKFYRDSYEEEALAPTATRAKILRRLFFEGSSPLRDEAANWFLGELRGRIDSVLKLLARIQPCSYGQLMAEYMEVGPGRQRELSVYLTTLIDRYRMVEARQPVFSNKGQKKTRYVISDNFLSAWLFALARNVELARIRPVSGAVARADSALQICEGIALEKMVRLLTEETSQAGKGGLALSDTVKGYWNKAGESDIEIDLVAADNDERIVRFGSCKRSASRFTSAELSSFAENVGRFLTTREGARFTGYEQQLALYSTSFSISIRQRLEKMGYMCIDINDFRQLITG